LIDSTFLSADKSHPAPPSVGIKPSPSRRPIEGILAAGCRYQQAGHWDSARRWKGTLIQYSGRLHRNHPAKTEVRIYDYVDRDVPMLLRMFEKRLTTYRAIGYARGEAPLGFAEPAEEQTIEYDQEALRHFEEDL
jgi:hypothetical protein